MIRYLVDLYGRNKLMFAYKIVLLWFLLAWAMLMVKLVYSTASSKFFGFGVMNDYFPTLFQNHQLYLSAFIFIYLLHVVAIFSEKRWVFSLHAGCLAVISYLLSIHEGGIYIQAFTTSAWVGLWLFWLSLQMDKWNGQDEQERSDTIHLAVTTVKILVAFVFLGGTIGKLTSGYWTGDVFMGLNFPRYSNNPLLVAMFSRSALLMEGLLALSIFIPNRYVFYFTTPAIMGMWFVTHPGIVDAVGPVIGACMACLFLVIPANTKWWVGLQQKLAPR